MNIKRLITHSFPPYFLLEEMIHVRRARLQI